MHASFKSALGDALILLSFGVFALWLVQGILSPPPPCETIHPAACDRQRDWP